MGTIARRLDAHGMPVFGRAAERAADAWRRISPVLRRAWDSDFRRRAISWTRFREKRLTLKGFLTFDRNARLRTYLYLAVALFYLSHAYGPGSVNNLVRIACRAIEYAGLPRNVYVVMSFEQAMEVHALQANLIARYDTNRNGTLDAKERRALTAETGLTPRDLTVSCRDGDPGRLVRAAYMKRVLPARITGEVKDAYALSPPELLRAIRRGNYQKGMAEYERQRAAMWKEVEPDLAYKYATPRDYLKWETWRRGLERFYGSARYLLSSGIYYVTHPRETYESLRQG